MKAQGLLNAAHHIDETYGPERLAAVLRACSPAVQARVAEGIGINWHPLEEFTEFLVAAQRVLQVPNLGEELGAASARANTRGVMLRIVIYLARPELILRRAATMWRQFNDAGELVMRKFDTNAAEIEITGIPRTPPIFCDTITGWARELATSAGGKRTSAKHIECRSRGDARCVWLARWSIPEGTPPAT